VQNVKQTVKAGGDEQAADAAIKDDPTPVKKPVEEPTQDGEPSRIDAIRPPKSVRDIKGSEKYKKFMTSLLNFFANEMKIDTKIAKKIVHDIWKQTPPSGNFNKLIFLEAIDKEIDIASILAKSGLNPAQQIRVLGALKKWAAQNSDLVDDRMTRILSQRDKEAEAPAEEPAAVSSPSKPESKPEPPVEPEEEADETPEVEPEATAEPEEEETPEPAPGPEASEEEETDETPEGVVTSILKSKAVSEKDIEAFLEDLKKLKALEEVRQKDAAQALGINVPKYKELMKKHPNVVKAIRRTQNEAAQKLLEALAKIVAENATPSEAKPAAAESEAEDSKSKKTKVKKAGKKKTLSSNEERQAAAKEPEQTPDPRFTGIAVRKIKNKYNNLTIENKINFNKSKEVIEKIHQVESVEKQSFIKNILFVVTLTNGEQFGLPKELQRNNLKFAFKEDEEALNPKAPVLDKVIKLAKIKGGKIEEKGIVKYGTALKESLMLRWKTIAGIK
jgi:chemotaxis protein histidine kinase CheA